MKMPSNEQPGGRYSPTVNSSSRLIEKVSVLANRQDVMNNFFLYGFCSLDAFHQPDLFSNSVNRVIRELQILWR